MSVDVRLVRPPAAQAEELDWIARIRAGDPSACEALHRRHHEALWRFAYAHVRSADAAEAIVHEVFLSLWRDAAESETATSVRAWLFGAVRHQALRHQRQARVAARFAARSAPEGTDALVPDAVPPSSTRPPDWSVARVLASLPERRRVAMTLRWHHEMRASEIGHVLGTTPEVARVLLSRARQELAALLGRARG